MFQKGNIPIYFQFYLFLKKGILWGDLEPGSRLPTTEELARTHNIANHSVRRALDLLTKEGLVNKRPGIGITVPPDSNFVMHSFDIHRGGHFKRILKDGYPKVLGSGLKEPPKHIAHIIGSQLDFYSEGKVNNIRILCVYKDPPGNKILAEGHFPGNTHYKYNDPSQLMDIFFGPKKDYLRYRAELRPWLCDIESAKILDVPDGTPVFHRTWIIRNPKDRLVAITEGINTANLQIETY